MLVSQLSCRICLVDAGCRTRIYITNIVSIFGLNLIQLVYTILHRVNLPFYPLLASKWVHMTPETFFRLGLKWLASRIGRAIGSILLRSRCSLRGRILRSGIVLGRLGKNGGGQCARENKCRKNNRNSAHLRKCHLNLLLCLIRHCKTQCFTCIYLEQYPCQTEANFYSSYFQ